MHAITLDGFGDPEVMRWTRVADPKPGPGEVIVEVAQEFMKTPQQVAEKLTNIKGEGRRSGYLMIADKDGNLRLVAVPLE